MDLKETSALTLLPQSSLQRLRQPAHGNLIIALCFLFILVGVYLLAEGKVSSKLRQTTLLEAQGARSDTICADEMESRSCFPTAPAAAPLPGHRALTWPPGRGQACAAARRLGCQATRHHRAQTCGNMVSIWDQLPPTHPSVLTDIWKGFRGPVLSAQAEVGL